MSQILEPVGQGVSRDTSRLLDGNRFDWMMVAVSFWFVGGLFLDGWAHNNGRVDNSFFTH